MPWSIPLLDGLSMTTVTSPALASMLVVLNASEPSAAALTVARAPTLPEEAGALASGVATLPRSAGGVYELPPQAASPAAASTPAIERIRRSRETMRKSMEGTFRVWGCVLQPTSARHRGEIAGRSAERLPR